MTKHWWKILTVLLLVYTLIVGFLGKVPRLNITNESIRNLYFHVPMWFGMIIILLVSVVHSIRYLRTKNTKNDLYAVECANAGILYGVLGIITGMLWAQYTWGSFWHGDPKQNAAAVGVLLYLAYTVLRGSLSQDEQKRGTLSAVYNVFAFAALIPLLFILPRLTDSMHPGANGNPGFNIYDQAKNMRIVFYPAVIGWTLLAWWLVTLRVRVRVLEAE